AGALLAERVGAAGSVVAESGGTMLLQTLASGGEMVLTAGGSIEAETLEAAQLEIESLDGSLSLERAASAADMTLTARGDLDVEALFAGGDISALGTAGALRARSVEAEGSFAAEAGDGALRLDLASVGGSVSLRSRASLAAADVAAGGTFDAASETADLVLERVTSGGSMTATAFETLSAIDVTAGGRLRFESETGDVLLSRVEGHASGDGAVEIVAGGGIYGGAAPAPRALFAAAGPAAPLADFDLAGLGAAAEVVLRADGDIGREQAPLTIIAPRLDAFSANGSIRLTALETVLGGAIDASRGGVALHAYGGLGTDERLAIRVRDSLDVRATDIRADVVHTAEEGALPLRLERIDGAELDTAELWIDAPNGLAIARMRG